MIYPSITLYSNYTIYTATKNIGLYYGKTKSRDLAKNIYFDIYASYIAMLCIDLVLMQI